MAIADDYEVLLAVLDHGSLTAAAKSLGRSLQAVSRALAEIERQLNVSLFTRTTRQVHPTPACLAFARRIRPATREINAARDELIDTQTWRVRLQHYFPVGRFGASDYVTTRDRFTLG